MSKVEYWNMNTAIIPQQYVQLDLSHFEDYICICYDECSVIIKIDSFYL